jgi:hypothetical protein
MHLKRKFILKKHFNSLLAQILSGFKGIFLQTALTKQKPCTQDNILHTGLFQAKVRGLCEYGEKHHTHYKFYLFNEELCATIAQINIRFSPNLL